jgi:hypothetical protein
LNIHTEMKPRISQIGTNFFQAILRWQI